MDPSVYSVELVKEELYFSKGASENSEGQQPYENVRRGWSS